MVNGVKVSLVYHLYCKDVESINVGVGGTTGLKMGFSGRIGWFFTAFGLQTPHSGPNRASSESRSDDRGDSCAAAEGEPSPSPLEVQEDSGTFICRFLSQRHPKAPRRDNFCHFLSTRAATTQPPDQNHRRPLAD